MQFGVRFCAPTTTQLGPFCRGCLSSTQGWPWWRFSCSPRQMNRWNSQKTCSPPPSEESPRVLITGGLGQLGVGLAQLLR
ncbi:hypothetical protein LDENG_00228180 [Lucifuga dentata]|nr:hypothetical protein LDENG_00228180 [Lucifuga dentata]